MYDKKVYKKFYLQALDEAIKNLDGDDLKKCKEALDNFMRNYCK